MTILQIAERKGIAPASVKKTIRRAYESGRIKDLPGFKDPIPEEVLFTLFPVNGYNKPSQPAEEKAAISVPTATRPAPKKEIHHTRLFRIFSALPLVMLGISASYGVFHFATHFIPTWVAVVEAMAFEATYIRLGLLSALNENEKALATRVSLGAVAVSVLYNTIAGAMYVYPELLESLTPNGGGWWSLLFWVVCSLHGAPLAVLAYNVSKLQIETR